METKEILKKVRKIEIKSKGLSHNIFSGHYHSAFKGHGMAFSEVREYQYGDEIRSIDWKITARYDHPYVKIFEEERELTVMLIIDMSASNNFGTQGMLKKDMILHIAAVLSFSAIHNNDKVGVILFSNVVEKYIPPKKGTSHILRIIRELISFQPTNVGTDISEALRYFTNVMKKRTTAFIISDFYDQAFWKALKIAARRHDMSAIRVSDVREREIPNVGYIHFVDQETGASSWLDTNQATQRTQYKEIWDRVNLELSQQFSKYGIDEAVIDTNEDFVPPLLKMFKKRELRK